MRIPFKYRFPLWGASRCAFLARRREPLGVDAEIAGDPVARVVDGERDLDAAGVALFPRERG